jgi:hypothetical protein
VIRHLGNRQQDEGYCSLAYSALACFRMGMSESVSFQSVKKSLWAASARREPDMVLILGNRVIGHQILLVGEMGTSTI